MSRLTEGTSPSAIGLDELCDFIKAFEAAGGTLEDLHTATSSQNAARAAVLAARCARVRPAPDEISQTPYSAQEIRVMLESATLPDELVDRFSQPTEFSRLVAENPQLKPKALEMLSEYLGAAGSKWDRLSAIAMRNYITAERVRQNVAKTQRDLYLAVVNDRPPLIDVTGEVPLSESLCELLSLLG